MSEPTLELIAIGREVLDGRVLDTNSVTIAERVKPLGLVPRYGQRVDDDRARILEAFRIAASRSQIVIVTGGLGPTSDDITAEVFASFLGETLSLNPQALKMVEERFAKMNRTMTEVQRKQALLPPSCQVIPNERGTAPAFLWEKKETQWFFLPGVPLEMDWILRTHILKRLPRREKVRQYTWMTQFTSEGRLQESLRAVEAQMAPGFEITYRTRYPENHVALYATCDTPERAALFERLCGEMNQILRPESFHQFDETGEAWGLERVVVEGLRAKKSHLCTVESCTGGLIAHRITGVSGSSEVFWGSMVVYDNQAKESLVGVPAELIAKHGAVSKEVATAMAEGGLSRMAKAGSRQFAIATTGIAGPTGGTKDKPVGLCHIALACSDGRVLHEELHGLAGLDRDRYKLFFSQKALELLRRSL